jgi:hypothetical protein
MRIIVSLLTGIVLISCRTTKEEDKRFFAPAQSSNEGIAGVNVNPPPDPRPGKPLPTLPIAPDPLEKGAFYQLCQAKNQLASPQILTINALLAAVHQQDCAAGERWLRDQRNRSIMIDSEELVELQSLALLRHYPHIRDLYIKIARGVEPVCPVPLPQNCHFTVPDF